ncbi:helix-turn-helix transcriptional regulator [Rhodanobacter sp. 115]|uniref:helix-turn-helix transcriptional regulator n=1 Tax=Rhodanobacter sp. FW021-MT20 TaxID=1162282 RepID=UPI0034E495EF
MVKPQPIAKLEPGDLVTEREAAASLGVAVRTLRNWRALRKGPHYRKIGTRLVRYHRADLAEFQRIMVGESGEAAA